jgi:hypothetical protein
MLEIVESTMVAEFRGKREGNEKARCGMGCHLHIANDGLDVGEGSTSGATPSGRFDMGRGGTSMAKGTGKKGRGCSKLPPSGSRSIRSLIDDEGPACDGGFTERGGRMGLAEEG